ncbi:hypothetical protein N7528_002158 [Penicillium herquei]|nr:hypothetical protein N7528_002158 [Penicillium herquei]
MGDPIPALRYLHNHLTFTILVLLLYLQRIHQLIKANPHPLMSSSTALAPGKGNRKNRQGSQDSLSSNDPIESLMDPETLASGEGKLIGPAAARILDTKKHEDDEKEDKGSLNIRIHLDLHAKIKLDLEADLYGDVVIGLL